MSLFPPRSCGLSLAFLLSAAFAPATVSAQAPATPAKPAYDIKANYTKYEYRIPMRDGKRYSPPSMYPRTKAVLIPSC